jgi:hypothetical protein
MTDRPRSKLVRASGTAVPFLVFVAGVSCTPPRSTPSADAGGTKSALVVLIDASTDAPAAPSAPAMTTADATAPAALPRGVARLVIQHVEARCFMGPHEERRFTVGYDLILEAGDVTDGGKPPRDLVFCSTRLPDGGSQKPRLGIWRNCREDKVCTALSDAGARQEVRCGKDDVFLEVIDGRTILHVPFGDREVAPYPMMIAPTLREKRIAEVDC